MIVDRFQDLGTTSPTQFDFGFGAIHRLARWTSELKIKRSLVALDPNVRAAGTTQEALDALKDSGCQIFLFDELQENPTEADVRRCVDALRDFAADGLIAIGGGSTIDTAKAANLLNARGGTIEEHRGRQTSGDPMLPMIIAPTTSGTGSESQSATLISHNQTHEKIACLAPELAPTVTLLDPALTRTVPTSVRAATSLDTLVHAAEAVVTRNKSALSQRYAEEALLLTLAYFDRATQNPDDDARAGMMLASAYAGLAIEHSMLGAAHALANPLTQHCGLSHGFAVGVSLPLVMEFNLQDPVVRSIYAQVALQADLSAAEASAQDAANTLLTHIKDLVRGTEAKKHLSRCASNFDVETLCDSAKKQWTAQFNPVPVPGTQWNTWYEALVDPQRAQG